VRVENHQIAARADNPIKPPRTRFVFTYLHGIDRPAAFLIKNLPTVSGRPGPPAPVSPGRPAPD
jgi:hypothetical protein